MICVYGKEYKQLLFVYRDGVLVGLHEVGRLTALRVLSLLPESAVWMMQEVAVE